MWLEDFITQAWQESVDSVPC